MTESQVPNTAPGELQGGELRGMRYVFLVSSAIFIFALTIRLAYLHEIRSTAFFDNLEQLRDSRYYDQEASRIASGDLLGKDPYFLGPLYGHVLGAFYVVWERDFAAIKVFQCILGAGSCVLLYHIGRRVFDERVGILAASILSLYGLQIYYHGLMLPTTLVLFVNLLFLLAIIPRGPTLSLRRCLIAGALIGIAAIAKSNALLLLPAAGVTIWLCYGQQSRRRRAALALSVAAGGALMLAPLVLRNYLVTDEFILITTSTGSNFLKGNGPSADGAHRPLPAGQRGIGLADHLSDRQINAHRAVQESREMTRLAWQHIVDHPWSALQLFGKKLRLFFNATELGIHDQFHFAQRHSRLLRVMPGLFGLIAPIGITGMVMGWSRRRRAGMIYATFFAQVVSFVLVFVLARYRVVAVACLILFASRQIVDWVCAIRGREWRHLWPSAMLVLVLGVCINIPMAEFPRELRFATLYQMTGDHHFSNHDDDAAIQAYRQALEAPDHAARPFNGRADCWTRIAEANQRMGRTAKAILAYRSLLAELEERSPDPMTERINGLRRQIRDLESAVTPSGVGVGRR